MRCDNCEQTKQLKRRKSPYHYTESGLPNIYLKNVEWYQCPKCKARRVLLPRMSQLHRCIAWRLVTKASTLSGAEIVFLRKMLRFNQAKFAKVLLGIQPVVLCRWETGERNHSRAHDKLIRFIYLTSQDDEYTREVHKELGKGLNELFAEIEREVDTPKVEIDPTECSPVREVQNALCQAAA